jgi:GTP diphosphokinase / guanosine-3',5'-bis(diphosphate) 3'-diphosphatase
VKALLSHYTSNKGVHEMLETESLSLILRSMKFAATKHRVQRRKDREASPYVNHRIEVAELLHTVGEVSDVPTLVAALLHDTIEDTKTSSHEIRSLFGEEVVSLVLEVTDDKSLPKEERKRLQIETAHKKSTGAKQIKLADKICNVRDVTNTPPHEWSLDRRAEYLDWTQQVVAGLRGANPALERLYDEALANGRKVIDDEYQKLEIDKDVEP